MSDQNSTPVQFGVIGGSGVYQMQGVEVVAEHDLSTPFGRPSDPVVEAQVAGRSVFFLPRHGKGHRYTPSEVPYQANVHVMMDGQIIKSGPKELVLELEEKGYEWLTQERAAQ